MSNQQVDPQATSKEWDNIFWDMRMDEITHLGGGDIRITLAQQADIVAPMERLEMENTPAHGRDSGSV